jgi:phosphoglycerate dehydrogenase-like enzyme
MTFRILVPDAKIVDPDLFDAAGRTSVAFDLTAVTSLDELSDEQLAACDAFCMFSVKPADEAFIEKLKRCRLVVRAGVGYDNVDLAACSSRGIAVANVPDYGINEVADHALAHMLNMVRGIRLFANRIQNDGIATGWNWEHGVHNRRTYRRRVGIVGLGRIGTAFARRCQGMGMEVWCHDPYLPSGGELAMQVTRTETLEELLGACDIISVHVPLSEETAGLIDDDAVAAMMPETMLINTSRGPVVDIDALYKGLKSGRIACAGFDVLPVEPPDPEHPLIKAWLAREDWIDERLTLTPHSAFLSPDAVADMRNKAIHLMADYLEGKPLKNCVNAHLLAEADRR